MLRSAALDFAPAMGGIVAFTVRRGNANVRRALLAYRAWRASYRDAARKLVYDANMDNVYVPNAPYYTDKGSKERNGRHDVYLRLPLPDGGYLVVGMGVTLRAKKPWRRLFKVARLAWNLFPLATRKHLRSYGLNRTSFACCVTDLMWEIDDQAIPVGRKAFPAVLTLYFENPDEPELWSECLDFKAGRWEMSLYKHAALRAWRGVRPE